MSSPAAATVSALNDDTDTLTSLPWGSLTAVVELGPPASETDLQA